MNAIIDTILNNILSTLLNFIYKWCANEGVNSLRPMDA